MVWRVILERNSMSEESMQFLNMVAERFFEIELEKLEKIQALINIAAALLAGEISEAQAEEARKGLIGDSEKIRE